MSRLTVWGTGGEEGVCLTCRSHRVLKYTVNTVCMIECSCLSRVEAECAFLFYR